MIQYHGTPIGGKSEESIRFLMGLHALVPITYPYQLHVVMEVCSSFITDNGAFTVWKQGGRIDPVGYVDWLHREGIVRHPGFDFALIPDVIEGTEEDNDALLRDWPSNVRGVPVYHLHESLERAERLSHEWPIVALGSSGQWSEPGSRDWWQRMNEIRSAFCDDEVPRCRLHGLRMLDPAVFSHLPLSSADSTNCGRNGTRNGTAIDERFSSGEGALITAWRIQKHNSVATWKEKRIPELSETLFDL